jgi:hypothetical protein
MSAECDVRRWPAKEIVVMAQNMTQPNQGNQGNNPSQGSNQGSTTAKKPGQETTVKNGDTSSSTNKK